MKVTDNPSPVPLNISTKVIKPSQAMASDHVRSKKRGETVTLSKTAETIATAARRVKEMPDVDMEKVVRIKTMLQNGAYNVDADKAASNMLTESLLKDR